MNWIFWTKIQLHVIEYISFRSLCSVYSDLVKSLKEKILTYHFSTVGTIVLQDVYSHHWIDEKEFFEVKNVKIRYYEIKMCYSICCYSYFTGYSALYITPCVSFVSGWEMFFLSSNVELLYARFTTWSMADLPSIEVSRNIHCSASIFVVNFCHEIL